MVAAGEDENHHSECEMLEKLIIKILAAVLKTLFAFVSLWGNPPPSAEYLITDYRFSGICIRLLQLSNER